jgi:hypothetical protein
LLRSQLMRTSSANSSAATSASLTGNFGKKWPKVTKDEPTIRVLNTIMLHKHNIFI